ncbi:MAG: hypothetical protein IJ356_05160 [Erysipelotrichaceae bacterium]|nr:hypothetical protein [Erysipelotrichaceae bacterium]
MKHRTVENICTVLMILSTFLISSKCSLTEENWTVLLLKPEKTLLYIFGTLGSILFCFLLYRLSQRVRKPLKALCIFTAICMPLSLMFIYEPINHQLQTTLHLLFAYLYFFEVNAIYIHILYTLHFREPKIFHHLLKIYLFILAGCTGLCVHFMVINTLFELAFTCSMTLLIDYSLHLLKE